MKRLILLFCCLMPITILAAARPAPLPESRLTGTLHGEGQTITNVANVVTSSGVSLVGLSNSKADATALSTTSNTLAQATALKQDASTAATDAELAAASNTLAQAISEVEVGNGNTTNLTITAGTTITLVFSNGLYYGILPSGDIVEYPYPIPLIDYNAPPTLVFPNQFASFSITATNIAASGTPEIFEYERHANLGDTIPITGTNLVGASWLVLSQSYTNTSTTNEFAYGSAPTLSASVEPGVILIAPTNANGIGEAALLNVAQATWAGPWNASKNGEFNIYGQGSLTIDGTNSWAYCAETESWLQSTNCNPYRATYAVPAAWTNGGTYTLSAHNGYGGEYGFSAPVEIKLIDEEMAWNDDTNTWIYIEDFGAIGYANLYQVGAHDSGTNINAAINAAGDWGTISSREESYGLIFFMGRAIDSGLENYRFKGLGTNGTYITWHENYGYDATHNEGLFTKSGNYELCDLSFINNPSVTNAVGKSFIHDNTASERPGKGIFRRVVLDQRDYVGAGSLAYCSLNTGGLEFIDCDIYGSSYLNTPRGRNITHTRTRFHGLNDAIYMYDFSGSRMVAFIQCSGMDFDRSLSWGRSQGRWLFSNNSSGPLDRIYLEGCSTTNLMIHPESPQQKNTGEQWLPENAETIFVGVPSGVSGKTNATLIGLATDYTGYPVVIVDGRGRGQMRYISSYNAGTITVDPPWRVAPDAGSKLAIGRYNTRQVIYDSWFDGVDPTFATASAGYEPYGSAINTVVDSTTFSDLRTGVALWAKVNEANGLNGVLFFNTVKNARFLDNRIGSALTYSRFTETVSNATTVAIGNSFRNGDYTGTVLWDINISLDGTYGSETKMDLSVIDANSSTGSLVFAGLSDGVDTNTVLLPNNDYNDAVANFSSITNYVEFNGVNAWFDTGVTSASDIKVRIYLKFHDIGGNGYDDADKIIGITAVPYYMVGIHTTPTPDQFYRGAASAVTDFADITGDWQLLTFDPQYGYVIVDKELESIGSTVSTGTIQIPRNTATAAQYAKCQIKLVEIWDDGVLIRQYNANNASGTTWTDSTGNYNATLINCTIGSE